MVSTELMSNGDDASSRSTLSATSASNDRPMERLWATPREAKRPRTEDEGVAVVQNKQLRTELEALRVHLARRSDSHQSQLTERDSLVSQLRRQLQYALTEEEHLRLELKTLTHTAAAEKLQLQRRVVELEAKLQTAERSASEWKETAEDAANELQRVLRESNLQIQLLSDELENAKNAPKRPAPAEFSVLESKVKMLEVSLRDKERQLQQAEDRIEQASAAVDASKEMRRMAERVAELESQERRLRQELVAQIESSKRSAIYDEKLMQMHQKLQLSEQRNDAAQKEIVSNYQRHEQEITRMKQDAMAVQLGMKKLAAQLEKSEQKCLALEKRLGRGAFNPQKSVKPTSELFVAKQETSELDSVQQYREAVYQLTGFKVELLKSDGVSLLRLRSMYTDKDDNELLVRMDPSGALELLETEFSGQINKRVFAYLTTCRSFPAFLSTLTLHLFEKQSLLGLQEHVQLMQDSKDWVC